MNKVTIAGRNVFPIGLGTWNMGDKAYQFEQEVEAIRAGLDHGVQAIDTAEMYGDGNAERLVAHAIKPYHREALFLISKVLPSNASKKQLPICLENSCLLYGERGRCQAFCIRMRGYTYQRFCFTVFLPFANIHKYPSV